MKILIGLGKLYCDITFCTFLFTFQMSLSFFNFIFINLVRAMLNEVN